VHEIRVENERGTFRHASSSPPPVFRQPRFRVRYLVSRTFFSLLAARTKRTYIIRLHPAVEFPLSDRLKTNNTGPSAGRTHHTVIRHYPSSELLPSGRMRGVSRNVKNVFWKSPLAHAMTAAFNRTPATYIIVVIAHRNRYPIIRGLGAHRDHKRWLNSIASCRPSRHACLFVPVEIKLENPEKCIPPLLQCNSIGNYIKIHGVITLCSDCFVFSRSLKRI